MFWPKHSNNNITKINSINQSTCAVFYFSLSFNLPKWLKMGLLCFFSKALKVKKTEAENIWLQLWKERNWRKEEETSHLHTLLSLAEIKPHQISTILCLFYTIILNNKENIHTIGSCTLRHLKHFELENNYFRFTCSSISKFLLLVKKQHLIPNSFSCVLIVTQPMMTWDYDPYCHDSTQFLSNFSFVYNINEIESPSFKKHINFDPTNGLELHKFTIVRFDILIVPKRKLTLNLWTRNCF